jgi:hypothetical protein
MRNGFHGHPAVQKAIEEVHRAAGTVALEIEGLITQAETHWQKDMLLKFCRLLDFAMAKPNVFKGSDRPLPIKYQRVPRPAPVGWIALGATKSWDCYVSTVNSRVVSGITTPYYSCNAETLQRYAVDIDVLRRSLFKEEKEFVRLYDAWLASQASPASSTPPRR